MEQIEEKEKSGNIPSDRPELDAVITSKNHLDAIKRMAHCVKEGKKVRIGMTRKNLGVFYKMVDIFSVLGYEIKVIEEINYKVGIHNGICKVIIPMRNN